MSAEELLRQGRLNDAFAALKDQVRKEPANAKLRVFLFQVLAVQGDWERALTQLNTAAEMDASTLAMAQMYREALSCEALRAEVFAGLRTPLVFGEPPPWLGHLLEALRLSAAGNHAAAQPLRDQAFEAAPATSGTIDGQAFAWIADADVRLGPVLEAVVNGRYYWIPMQHIQQIDVRAAHRSARLGLDAGAFHVGQRRTVRRRHPDPIPWIGAGRGRGDPSGEKDRLGRSGSRSLPGARSADVDHRRR